MLEAKSIVSEFPQVVAENLFVQIPEEMELFDADVSAFQLALEKAPEVFESVGVNLSVNVPFRMVHDLMLEVLMLEHIVGVESVSVDRAVCFDVTANLGIKNGFAAIWNDRCANFSTAFQHSHDWSLVFGASFRDAATALLRVHESCSATDEGLVYFNLFAASTNLPQWFLVHRKPNSVKHEPRRLLSDAQSASNFIGTDSVLAIRKHPHSNQPLVERNRGIFHDGSDLHGELPLGVFLFALPHPASGDESHVSPATSRAGNAIGPATRHHELDAVVRVGEMLDGLLESFGLAHGVPHYQKYARNALLSQVYYCLCKCWF